MNLHSALASGKEGMEFTVISVIGTLVIGWFIGRKLFKIDRNTAYLISSGNCLSVVVVLSQQWTSVESEGQ